MPTFKRRFRKRKTGRRARRNPRVARSIMFNPRPTFTETFRIRGNDPLAPDYQMDSNGGGILKVRISDMPQIQQYKSLYQKYRILKVKFICLPQFVTTSSDVNSAAYNASLGLGNWGMARIATVINDTPNLPFPVNEDDILEDNGCKIHTGKSKLVLTCRPVPDTLDANGNRFTMKRKFLNFVSTGNDIDHYGIRWWYTLPNPGGNIQNIPYYVYVKLTFQLADPR